MSETLPPVLEKIQNQDSVKNFLGRAVSEGHVTHAYLFVGAPGSGMEEAAEALAECLVCPQGGDGTCGECIRVRHHTHPDVRWIAPESAAGYLVSQIRDLIDDVQLAPVRSRTKVYILDNAGLLRGASANALLKTLEEPPAQVVFILCARSAEAVLATIVSRCQVVPFRAIPEKVAVQTVVKAAGTSAADARIALSVAGTPAAAAAFLGEPSRRELRALVVRTLGELSRDDSWDVLLAARAIAEAVREPLKDVKRSQKKAKEEASDYLSAAALHELEDAQKRELTARERSGMMEVFAAADSVLRDALLVSQGHAEDVVNADFSEAVESLAASGASGILDAFRSVGEARDSLAHHVSSQLTLEVMLCAIKEALS